MKLKNCLVCLILVSSLFCFSQNKKRLDSLWIAWNNTSIHDTLRLQALNAFIWNGFLFSDPDSALRLVNLQHDFSKRKNIRSHEAAALNTKGVAHYILGDGKKAKSFLEESLKIREELQDRMGIAMCLNNLGGIYQEEGNYARAIDLYTRSLKIKEEIKDESGIAQTLSNIGLLYYNQGNLDKGIELCNQALKVYERRKDKKGISTVLNTLAGIYEEKRDTATAMRLYLRELKICGEQGDKSGLATCYNNIGYLYSNQKDYNTALSYHEKSLAIKKEMGDPSGIAISYSNMADIFREKGDHSKALDYGAKALKISRETEELMGVKNAASTLHKSFAATQKFKDAYEMHLLYIQMRDSIQSEESKSEVLRKDLEYNYEKDKALSQKEHEKELAVAEEQRQKQRVIIISGIIGLALVVMFALFIVNRLRVTNKQKRIIEKQKVVVEQQKKEVEFQKHEIEHQKELVEEKQQEIIDSINYAKRLQNAILPPASYINTHFRENFILYLPKDIVAGDFYWAEQADNLLYLAAADSTGHGVPGAMVSIVCSNGLNKSLKEFGLRKPGEILDKTREIVLDTFAKSGEEIKDGMDVSLICIDKQNKKISWSGANNQLWYISDNILKEIKADKQPVGKSDNPAPFKTWELDWKEGTVFYLMTDGYADQFGGDKGKKFKYKQLENLLIDISSKPLAEQKQILQARFMDWKKDLEQVDDVTILGVMI